ncbi:YtpR family tRNA-binding protein [Liquorilactobacillus satsumensis]|uniref:tRNA-binding domain-containing protein n=1 Tax=Liquorilactobacillus satsumensis DSM 16230 = JCM 12392 TaxID=1423801 RepID=A0A0R1VA06_9LACO|nr:DUF4479 and tRNA-binding domain-containing protein [Liquorilactobacillus satsumensis]KRL99826.1 tRNA-binding domain-containing protein [Liquorilactobacillus satsumensis DSM 16230 = JCM 12392]MCC7665684.1 DUF4479 domain-containing protein [Liquorilactobacillus satsumensis]MCP9328304.1 DUF4479 and tRNA-binding domain-containing protein [Liquorilactobacillus satsumensis]MCP9356523.1 DUF4479 and tRNA-binding domain-containing protein [Liquorilactobacillus satsumensis]MCP9370338.1 DUF4479 and tR
MLIASYNPAQLGDVLVVLLHQDTPKQVVKRAGDIVEISSEEDGTVLGYNFFNVSEYLGKMGTGQIFLTAAQLENLQQQLEQVGFTTKLELDRTPKFVVGYVEELKEHPDSDHLHITKTRISATEVLQIVCGAPNIAAGQLVVVAKVGAMMPNGEIIWPGKLRGVESDGMICSARELELPHAPQKRGILVLSATKYQVGASFALK